MYYLFYFCLLFIDIYELLGYFAATPSLPVMPAVIEQTQPFHSAPSKQHIDDSTSSSAAESDSDDEGTVYADTKEDFNDSPEEIKASNQRPESSLSVTSNTHTDNTVVSTDNLSDEVDECINEIDKVIISSNVPADNIPHIQVNSASSSADSESDIEKTNIDDIVREEGSNVTDSDSNAVSDSDVSAAASIVEEAMKAAMNIIKSESEENNSSHDEEPQSVDCNNIDVDFESDVEADQGDVAVSDVGMVGDDIDDSDEADALSASSLD